MYLDKIVATKQHEVAALKQLTTVTSLERAIAAMPPTRRFEQALAQRNRQQMGLIAEVKKASPSKGLIRADFNPVAIAEAYERAGADCLSVLTDVHYFQGENLYLQQIRAAVDVPILRKDFTIDEMQIYEARAIGADAILLIAAILTTDQMKRFLREARDLSLDVLVEVHDEAELERVLEIDASMIGINNRNLHTFETDIRTTERLIARIPDGVIKVTESGISQSDEIAYLASVGADAALIGEHFMRRDSVEQAVCDLLGERASRGGSTA